MTGLVGRDPFASFDDPGGTNELPAKLILEDPSNLFPPLMEELEWIEPPLPCRLWPPNPRWRRCEGEGGVLSRCTGGSLTRMIVSLQEVDREGFKLS